MTTSSVSHPAFLPTAPLPLVKATLRETASPRQPHLLPVSPFHRSPPHRPFGGHEQRAAFRCNAKQLTQAVTSPPPSPNESRYRQSYPLPAGVETKAHTYTDPRGRTWTYDSDSIPMYEDESLPPTHIVVCLQNVASLGVNRTYWDRMFDFVSANLTMAHPLRIQFKRFDWVGTGTTRPKPDSLPEPYTIDYFAAQVNHFISTLSLTSHPSSTPTAETKLIIIAHGPSEPISVRVAVANENVSGLVIDNGLSDKSITQKRDDERSAFVYGILRGWFGRLFYKFVATRSFISGFAKKNLLNDERLLTQFVDAALEGASDSRLRFNVFSFLSGNLFGDYRPDFAQLDACKDRCPTLFFAGGVRRQKTKSNRAIDAQIKTARIPVPLVADESVFEDSTLDRLRLRQKLVPSARTVLLEKAGIQSFFETVEDSVPKLISFIKEI